MHVHLRVGESRGEPAYETIHAEALGGRRFRVEFTPGFAYGVAAGDEIELADDGTFEVVSRAGNVAVRVFSSQSLADAEPSLTALVESVLDGHLDGNIGRGVAYTIPIQAGFPAIEQLFDEFAAATSGTTWEFGNVYAEDGSPIGWWQDAA
jgi:hypothetical protein